jgi:carbamoyl-phosphate synthase large subunit
MPSQKILVLGTGPTLMGQGPECNLATLAACRALRELGHTVIMLESHAASLACDPAFAHVVYFEPINRATVEQIVNAELPNCVLATVSGQHALNIALLLHQLPFGLKSHLAFFGTAGDLLQATQDAETFARVVRGLGGHTPDLFVVSKQKQGEDLGRQLGFPVVVRPVLAPGGIGTAITYNTRELERAVEVALAVSPTGKVVVEKSLAGQKRTDWAVLRDLRGSVRVVGSIEYIEPLGIHSADSPAVSPAQTLSAEKKDRARRLAVELVARFQLIGAATVQFAHDDDNRMTVLSVTPRVSRTSLLCGRVAMVSIAAWHVRLCGGVPIDELPASESQASAELFEPAATEPERIWVRLPLFPGLRLMAPREALTTYPKSVGAVTTCGDSFLCALERAFAAGGGPALGPGCDSARHTAQLEDDEFRNELSRPTRNRMSLVYHALQMGMDTDEVHLLTGYDQFFCRQFAALADFEHRWDAFQPRELIARSEGQFELLREAKRLGCSDEQLAAALDLDSARFAEYRAQRGLVAGADCLTHCALEHASGPVYRTVSYAPHAARLQQQPGNRILILGSAGSVLEWMPEFDYLTARMIRSLHSDGVSTVLLSPNALHLADECGVPFVHYLDPVQPETVAAVFELERPSGVIIQCVHRHSDAVRAFLRESRIPLLGTSIDEIERLDARNRFQLLLQKLEIRQPTHGVAANAREAYRLATHDIGYPVMVHPAHALHIPRVAIWYDEQDARAFLEQAPSLTELYPLSIEQFLEEGREFQLQAIGDGQCAITTGILELVEEAGVHYADSAAVWPPRTIPPEILDESRDLAQRLAAELKLRGFFGVNCAYARDRLYILDILPHASGSTVFLDAVTGGKLIPVAARVLLGTSLADIDWSEPSGDFLGVRAPVFPFSHYPGTDASLGPENCSIGHAVSVARTFGAAYAKALMAAGNRLPTKGNALLSVADHDKQAIIPVAKKLRSLGFGILATTGTAAVLEQEGIPVDAVMKLQEGRPHIIDRIIDGDVNLIINTPHGKANRIAEAHIRHEAVDRGILLVTTVAGAIAAVDGVEAFMRHKTDILPLDSYVKDLRHQRSLPFDQQPDLELKS